MSLTTAPQKRIAVIGGGPIGLEAALRGRLAGFVVDLYEQGDVAANVREWGHVRLFSPFGMNSSQAARQALRENHSHTELPLEDQFLTGQEYAEQYLIPLSRLPLLSSSIHDWTKVLGVSRSRFWKGELIGQAARGEDPFRLLLESSARSQRSATADYVLDCSGVYPHHNWLGAGGVPAVGETAAAKHIEYRLPDVLGRDEDQYAGKLTLVVGGGYSAATAIVELAELANRHRNTRVFWLTRSQLASPIVEIEDDPLPQRELLTKRANKLVVSPTPKFPWFSGRVIEAIEINDGQGSLQVKFRSLPRDSVPEELRVDRLIANVGYHPDHALSENLQVHICYATSGPMKLAAALLGESSADCLNQTSAGAESLCNPEPGFFILGAKSYGRDSRFLIRVGLQQIEDVFSLITPCSK